MDIEEEVFSARLGISQNMNEASLSDTILYTRREGPQGMRSPSSMAIRPNDRIWFVRLHNFNSNSEYYINLVDGIGVTEQIKQVFFAISGASTFSNFKHFKQLFMILSRLCLLTI